ncbi:MAG: YIP1 family protein [Gemmatimonadaceae bacterium]
MTLPDDFAPAVPPASVKPVGLWEDFIDIFVSPSEVFERRKDSGFFVPLLVFAVFTIVITIVGHSALQPLIDGEFNRGIAAASKQNPQLTQEQLAGPRALMEKFTPVIVAVSAFLQPILIGVVLWLAGKFVEAKESLGAACMVAAYAVFPRVIDTLLRVGQATMMNPAMLTGQYRVSLSPARFLDPDVASPVLVGILGRFDLFTIWVTILLAIGLSVVAKIPRSKAAMAALIVWVVGALPILFGALRTS